MKSISVHGPVKELFDAVGERVQWIGGGRPSASELLFLLLDTYIGMRRLRVPAGLYDAAAGIIQKGGRSWRG